MEYTCKDGRILTCRELKASDTGAHKAFLRRFSRQTIFTNQYPDQPEKTDEELEKDYLSDSFFHFGAFLGAEMAGVARAHILNPNHPWLCYTTDFALMILEDWQGQGLGSLFLHEIEAWARQKGLHRITGEVRASNIKGLTLYLKKGFTVEGCSKGTAFINNRWHDSYHIGKILEGER